MLAIFWRTTTEFHGYTADINPRASVFEGRQKAKIGRMGVDLGIPRAIRVGGSNRRLQTVNGFEIIGDSQISGIMSKLILYELFAGVGEGRALHFLDDRAELVLGQFLNYVLEFDLFDIMLLFQVPQQANNSLQLLLGLQTQEALGPGVVDPVTLTVFARHS